MYKEPLHIKIASFFSSVVMIVVGLGALAVCGFGGYIAWQVLQTF